MVKEYLINLKKHVNLFNSTPITAEKIALDNDIEYVESAIGGIISSSQQVAICTYAHDDKFILLCPANDVIPTYPIEWYTSNNEKIMDNQASFDNITNLNEIILAMIRLYTKYIDDDVFISPAGFAIKLQEEVSSNYRGTASFVLTKDAIRNKEKFERSYKVKKNILNNFLDHFIGWNFGVVISNNAWLEQELLEFNNLVISKGLREYAGNGLDVFQTEKVKSYDLKYPNKN